MSASRLLSLIIAAVYLVVTSFAAYYRGKLLATLLIVGGTLLLPLLCIWFGDELGEYVGALPGPAVTRKSPGWVVKLGRWVLLLLPALVGLWFMYQ